MAVKTYVTVDCRQIYLDCQAYFAANSIPAKVVFGWRETTKQINQSPQGAGRVVFIPGDDSGKAGKYTGPVQLGGKLRRHLKNKQELFQIRIWGVDNTAPIDEAAQYAATRSLEVAVLNSLAQSALGRFEISDPKWTTSPTEKLFGKELLLLVQLDVPVFFQPLPPDVPGPTNEPEPSTAFGGWNGDIPICPRT